MSTFTISGTVIYRLKMHRLMQTLQEYYELVAIKYLYITDAESEAPEAE